MRRIRRFAVVITASLSILFAGAWTANGANWSVGPKGDFSTISGALEAAADGDVIRVERGDYQERVLVDRSVQLVGNPGAVIDGQGQGSTVTVTADGAVVQGFTVRGSGMRLTKDDAGITIQGAAGVMVRGNRLEGNLHGIYVSEAADAGLFENVISGPGHLIQEDRGNGIHMFHSPGARIARNQITTTRDGVYFSFSHGAEVRDNRVTQARYGLHYMYSDDNLFEGNLFEENVAGAALMFSNRLRLLDNQFVNNRGRRAYGLFLKAVGEVHASGNLIAFNTTGVFVDQSNRNELHGNLLVHNDVAVLLNASGRHNRFEGNHFGGNLEDVRVDGTLPDAFSGNYWDTYAGLDLDGDGFGDSPHQSGEIYAELIARHPELQLFVHGPAFRFLSQLERWFPVVRIPRAMDVRPLAQPRELRTGAYSLGAESAKPSWTMGALSLGGLLLAIYARQRGGRYRWRPSKS